MKKQSHTRTHSRPSTPKRARVNWQSVEAQFLEGQSLQALSRAHQVSRTSIRRKKRGKNWRRTQGKGITSLRASVQAMSETLQQADPDDATTITRIGAALSMAAARLARVENPKTKTTKLAKETPPWESQNDDFNHREILRELIENLQNPPDEPS